MGGQLLFDYMEELSVDSGDEFVTKISEGEQLLFDFMKDSLIIEDVGDEQTSFNFMEEVVNENLNT